MRLLIYFLFIILTCFSCRIYYAKPVIDPYELKTTKPLNKAFKEIQFDIWYQPKYTEKEKKEVMTDYDQCFKNDPNEDYQMICKLSKARIAKDQVRIDMKSYCYDIKQDKPSIFKKNIKARLYDKAGNILAEDYLRCDRNLDGTDTCNQESMPHLDFYLPYLEKADKVKVIKTENGKEITLNEIEILNEKKVKNSKDYGHGGVCSSIYLGPIY